MLSTRTFFALCLAALALLLTPLAAQAATINVSPAAPDEGVSTDDLCSLREAVISSNFDSVVAPDVSDCTVGSGADTIQLAGNDVTLDEAGPNESFADTGDLDVLEELTVTSSTGNPQIDQAAADRVFEVSNASLTLVNLTVTGGSLASSASSVGGNIRFVGSGVETLRLDNVDVTLGQANSGSSLNTGGGIHGSGGAVIVENGSSVTQNSANVVPGGGNGGGIYVDGAGADLTVSDSSVTDNEAAVDVAGGDGGGIYFAGSGVNADLLLDSATVTGNGAGGGAPVVGSPSRGGGVFVDGVVGGTVSIQGTPQSSISDNHAGGGTGNGPGEGGGLSVEGTGLLVDIDGAEISDNRAGGRGGTGNGDGAGIWSSSDMDISGATIADNVGGAAGSVASAGAGILTTEAGLTLASSTVSGNDANGASGFGGGIALETTADPLTITSSTISGNSATDGGGGVYRTVLAPNLPNDSISSSTISGNTVAGGVGAKGGGLRFDTAGTLAITSSTISGNTVTGASGSPSFGGGADLSNQSNAGIGTYSLLNSTVSGNTATSAADGGIGGGIALRATAVANAVATANHTTFNANTATATGGGGAGGNLYAETPSVFLAEFELRASIVAGGVGLAGSENCETSGANATFDSLDFNVESTTPSQCGLDQPDDADGSDPLLGALALNGGTTLNHALGSGSPAIDRVTSGCPPPALDQRGTARPQGEAECDSGSFEFITPPIVTGVTPASGSNENQPEVTGTAPVGSTVNLFTNPGCTGSPVASGSAVTFISPGITVAVADNTTTTFYASSTGGPGPTGCSTTSVTYQELTPPAAPTITATSPASGANDNQPEIIGTAPAGTTVDIYTNASCTGSPVATGSQAAFASPGITVNVADNSTTTFRATSTNAGGTSACSATSVTYQELTPPVVIPPDPTPPKRCKKGQKLKKGKCVKKRKRKK